MFVWQAAQTPETAKNSPCTTGRGSPACSFAGPIVGFGVAGGGGVRVGPEAVGSAVGVGAGAELHAEMASTARPAISQRGLTTNGCRFDHQGGLSSTFEPAGAAALRCSPAG